MSEDVVEEWLEKWGKLQYRRRWFVLNQKSKKLSYFEDTTDKIAKKEMKVENSYVIDMESDCEFTLHNDICQWKIRAQSKGMKFYWVKSLVINGAKKMTEEEYKHYLSYGELTPYLCFPTVNEEKALKMKSEEKNALQKNLSHLVFVFENVSKIAINLIPGGGVVEVVAGGAFLGGTKLYLMFQNSKWKDIIKNLDAKVDKKIFENSLLTLESEMLTTQRRHEMMINADLSFAQREAELTTAMQSFEKVLLLFQLKGNLFLDNALMVAPFLTRFATLYILFAQDAVQISPGYGSCICQVMDSLKECLTLYKSTAMEQRLKAIHLNTNYLARYDNIVDDKYPSDTGFKQRTVYINFEKYGKGEIQFTVYKNKIRELYADFFDDKIIAVTEYRKIIDVILKQKTDELKS